MLEFADVSPAAPDRVETLAETYNRDGYVVIRNLFTAVEMQELDRESARLFADVEGRVSPQNLRCRYMPHHETGEQLFEVFDPVNDISPVCERFSLDLRITRVIEAIYGEPACLFKEKLIFKPPGATGYQLHQDIPLWWKGFPRTFLSVLIPIDPSSEKNGCTEVFTNYHHDFLCTTPQDYMLPDTAVDVSRRVPLILEPGDVAIFHGLTPHRSGPNRSSRMRRAFYVSFNAQSDGGDQHQLHYEQFHQFLKARRPADEQAGMFFR